MALSLSESIHLLNTCEPNNHLSETSDLRFFPSNLPASKPPHYTRSGLPLQSLSLFKQMLAFPIQPNAFTLSSVIKACSQLNDELNIGRCFHSMVFIPTLLFLVL
ncbi:pentatricopeptide (PPR) repeat protein [Trifolium pratense]|uniref:Pentatricopeptide (PPR) repeat protein n=1 Tax=Trifolium pratense TaxID=57577 RepID=A0A2K3JXE3_TRIPR|nr:pentatricopeptide (PPR) repeat protein [Trifolium pratense]